MLGAERRGQKVGSTGPWGQAGREAFLEEEAVVRLSWEGDGGCGPWGISGCARDRPPADLRRTGPERGASAH